VLVLLFVASRPSYENRHLVIAGFTLWSWGLLTSSVTRFHVVFSIDFTTVRHCLLWFVLGTVQSTRRYR
jgi:hypothetical protein